MELLIQAISLVGAVLILWAFVGLQRNRWRSDARGYLWANFAGSSLLTAVAAWDQRIGFVLLELVWALVSLWSIVRPPRGS
jgi:hypothetical protein